MSQHSTRDERAKNKYYCNICDTVFFCKLYMDKHTNGIKHKKILSNINNIRNIDENKKLKKEIIKQNLILKSNLNDLLLIINNIK